MSRQPSSITASNRNGRSNELFLAELLTVSHNLSQKDQADLKMREYEVVFEFIKHSDGDRWQQNQFFVAIQAGLLVIMSNQLLKQFMAGKSLPPSLLIGLVAVSVFNILLCYIWFRSLRSTNEYQRLRREWLLAIEDDPVLEGILGFRHWQQAKLQGLKLIKHGSGKWINYLPWLFVVAWVIVLASGALDPNLGTKIWSFSPYMSEIIVSVVIFLMLSGIAFVEVTGFPWGKRKLDQ